MKLKDSRNSIEINENDDSTRKNKKKTKISRISFVESFLDLTSKEVD